MASASITIRAVEALAQGETIWDAGHKEGKQSGALACDISAATQPKCSSTGCSAASGSSRSGHTGHLGRQQARREAKRLLGLVADGKDPAETKAKPTSRRLIHFARSRVNTSTLPRRSKRTINTKGSPAGPNQTALDARILAARKKVNKDAKPLPHWTVHDLRRTAATVMADRLPRRVTIRIVIAIPTAKSMTCRLWPVPLRRPQIRSLKTGLTLPSVP